MPKNFFFFSKGQRTAIITLLILIVVVIIADYTLSLWAPQPKSFYDETFTEEIRAFEEEINTAKKAIENNKKAFPSEKFQKEEKQKTIILFAFDPNTLDSTGFIALGLKPWITSNILKYRKKGGRFKTSEDFGKIYGIDTKMFSTLQPFITIEETPTEETEIAIPDIIIELNSADTTQLATIMKKGLAKRIVGYRKTLGGYYSLEQLKEVYNITDEDIRNIIPYLKIDTTNLRKIDVNKASVEQLKRHPYINFYQAKAIYELRKAKKNLSSINDILHLEEFSKNDIKRITPYLNFEQ